MSGSDRIRLQLITMDESLAAQYPNVRKTQKWFWVAGSETATIGDGPSCDSLKIVSYDDRKQALDGAKWNAAENKFLVSGEGVTDPIEFRALSVFSTVLFTLHQFEERGAIGRKIGWRKTDEPLVVHINSDTNRSAEYDRAGHCLRFSIRTIQVDEDPRNQVVIDTARSPDIVAHETAHAIVDSLAPALLGAIEPESRAIHEAVADLAAVIVAFEMQHLREFILTQNPNLRKSGEAYGRIAESAGVLLANSTKENTDLRSVRNLITGKTLLPDKPNSVSAGSGAHALSQVFSSAVYNTFLDEYSDRRVVIDNDPNNNESTGFTLVATFSKLKRALFRGIDYLPDSDIVTFLDLARSMLLADSIVYASEEQAEFRNRLIQNFADRGIGTQEALQTSIANEISELFSDTDLDQLLNDEDALYKFIDQNRPAFLAPEFLTLKLSVSEQTKTFPLGNQSFKQIDEVVLKISWFGTTKLPNQVGAMRTYSVKFGTTVVIDKNSKLVLFILSTNRDGTIDHDEYHEDRTGKWADEASRLMGLTAEVRLEATDFADSDAVDYPHWFVDNGAIRFGNLTSLLHQR